MVGRKEGESFWEVVIVRVQKFERLCLLEQAGATAQLWPAIGVRSSLVSLVFVTGRVCGFGGQYHSYRQAATDLHCGELVGLVLHRVEQRAWGRGGRAPPPKPRI